MVHKCESCEQGTRGIYIKICESTGEFIETYNDQLARLVKGLMDNRNFVTHVSGVDEH
jgi:hypothetical protein